ncbi:hypothetical protein Scep_024300 [Stephania cephalantha]|uniref:Uncharacterized protein n=1 Tax=Stephania cephalantha TaxID=152367 RepID=A0AAP0EWB1_9MAGN
MRYRYIRIEWQWIREEDILEDERYEGSVSPHESDPLVDFKKRDYLNYSFLFRHVDGNRDGVQQEPPTYPAPPAPQEPKQPP